MKKITELERDIMAVHCCSIEEARQILKDYKKKEKQLEK